MRWGVADAASANPNGVAAGDVKHIHTSLLVRGPSTRICGSMGTAATSVPVSASIT